MKDTTFSVGIGLVLGVALGAGLVSIASSVSRGDRNMTVTTVDGSHRDIKIYRGEDCNRWGKVIQLFAPDGTKFECSRPQLGMFEYHPPRAWRSANSG